MLVYPGALRTPAITSNVSYRARFGKRLSLNANYTLARAMAYDGDGGSYRYYPRDPEKPLNKWEFGPSFNDERNHLTTSGIWNMPWGLEFSPILQVGSARPYNPISATNRLNLSGGSQVGAIVVPTSNPNDLTTYGLGSTPAAVRCYYSGNCHLPQYDLLRGDPYFDMDARIAKNFRFGERMNIQLAFQAFNLFNHANYGNNFDPTIQDSTFGHAIGFINPSSTTLPRSFTGEFGFRLTF